MSECGHCGLRLINLCRSLGGQRLRRCSPGHLKRRPPRSPSVLQPCGASGSRPALRLGPGREPSAVRSRGGPCPLFWPPGVLRAVGAMFRTPLCAAGSTRHVSEKLRIYSLSGLPSQKKKKKVASEFGNWEQMKSDLTGTLDSDCGK